MGKARRSVATVTTLLTVLLGCGLGEDPEQRSAPDRPIAGPSAETGAEAAPRTTRARTWAAPVRRSADDAEQSARGRVRLRSADLELVRDRARQRVGLRFTGVPLPRNARIRRAWIQLTADERTVTATELVLRAQATGHAARFRPARGDVSARRTTSAYVRWAPRPWRKAGARGGRQRTPDLGMLVQQVVERPDWEPGNAIAIIVSGRGSRVAASFESRRRAPVLHIEWVGAAGPRGFAFAAAGDYGANRHVARGLAALDRSPAAFNLALGDLDYDQTSSDRAWCAYVRNRLPRKGARFPFELLAGNHEEDGGPDGHINVFAQCLPDRLSADTGPSSGYGAEYAFDFPPDRPLARVVLISPNITVNGIRHTYQTRSPHRAWLVEQIDRARARGQWVVVGMHYPCVTAGRHGCDAGALVLNLLVRKRVDLVLAGHNHIYERSKQLRHGPGCPWVRSGRFDVDCVADPGRDARYRRGAGTVLVTAGTFGGKPQGVNPGDRDRRYFARVDGRSYGFAQFHVRQGRLHGQFRATSGGLRDSFDVVAR